ncbi:MAG TPA: lysoplasmalogenase [Cyclobacteriaceae bacterium]|jgi:uncharacterized membrane protein YhhN|nr:lysoplasmalogenase [Cyclobacteriaceae bacterium]
MKKTVLYIFLLASVGELVTTVFELPILHLICKPLIMITLGSYYLLTVHREDRSTSLIEAVVFSLVGDVLLMIEDSSGLFFKLGLAAFLLAHVFYILTYRQHRTEGEADKLKGIQKMRLAFPIILSATGLLVILYPVLGDLRIPVIIYTLVIMFMTLNALYRFGLTNTKSFFMVFAGAILFMLSDSILAISKFRHPIEHADLMVMSSYIAAQFLIVRGLIYHSRK